MRKGQKRGRKGVREEKKTEEIRKGIKRGRKGVREENRRDKEMAKEGEKKR